MNSQMKCPASDPAPVMDGGYGGEPTLNSRGRIRVDAKGPSVFKTYRCPFSVVIPGAGDGVELRGAAGVQGWVTKVTIWKPSVAVTVDLIKRTAQDTVGTPVQPSITFHRTADGAPSLTVNTYAGGVPTPGATTGGGGNVYPSAAMGAGDVLTAEFGERSAEPVNLASTESLAIHVSGAVTLVGMVEWMEE